MAQSESVQYFQFDKEGNMFVFPPGSGFSGKPRLVKPGESLIFEENHVTEMQCLEISDSVGLISPTGCDGIGDKSVLSTEISQENLAIASR